MSKSMSKMNKSELYTLAKQQKEELMTASLFNNSLEEENEKLKKDYGVLESMYAECHKSDCEGSDRLVIREKEIEKLKLQFNNLIYLIKTAYFKNNLQIKMLKALDTLD